MTDSVDKNMLLQTKLFRPDIPVDFVCRDRLHPLLERSCHTPVTLVSAPAGYGKSTLVSHWLDRCDLPSAWVSLDENNNDLVIFLQYLLAAIHSVHPKACQNTEALANSPELLAVQDVATCFRNELNQIQSPFILSLDDYHRIQEPSVHELISTLLKHIPLSVHWILITRHDPPISVNILRANGKLTEIRQSDLQFSKEETVQFFQHLPEHKTDGLDVSRLYEYTEGWPVGLRLASLALTHQDSKKDILESFQPGIASIEDYLFTEVLSMHSQEVQACILKMSIVNRFCGALCESICDCAINGEDFIRKMRQENFFCVSLDNKAKWYRFHHLFQEIMQKQLANKQGHEHVQSLHRQASTWYEQHGFIEEALQHMVEAGDTQEVASLICRHRLAMMNTEQWHRLNNWLSLLPKEVVETNPELLILKALIYENRSRRLEAYQLLDPFELLLKDTPMDEVFRERLVGEMNVLRSMQYYDEGDGRRALVHAKNALDRLPTEYGGSRGFAVMLKAASLQMTGDLRGAHEFISEAMQQIPDTRDANKSRLLFPLCFVNWIAGDLQALERSGKALLDMGTENQLLETTNFGSYFYGLGKYYQNQLNVAEQLIASIFSDRVISNLNNHIRITFLQCLIDQASGRGDDAKERIETMIEKLLKTGNSYALSLMEAFAAELDLRQGKSERAVQWVKTVDTDNPKAGYSIHIPELTAAKAYLIQGTKSSLKQADELLCSLYKYFEKTHNTRYLIDVLALQAMLYDAKGNESAALEALEQSIKLAQPGGFIRNFIDIGPSLSNLLKKLIRKNIAVEYVGQLITAFSKEGHKTENQMTEKKKRITSSTSSQPLPEPLSQRELEILEKLSQRLSNKEIAQELFISHVTVKSHTLNIYEKLNVHHRQEAVEKAIILGLLSEV